MKHIPTIAGALLGLAFLTFGLNHWLHFLPMGDGPPEGSPPALFFGSIIPTGFLSFVKVLEIIGGALVAVPRNRHFRPLILGPIIVNILAFHIFIVKGGLLQPPVVLISVLGAFLLSAGRGAFAKLAN